MTSPAQVSGPGAYSARTDTGGQPIRELPNPDYGEATAFREQQKAAPLAAAPGAGPTPSVPAGGPAPESMQERPATPLFAPSQRPDEPITAGVPFGPGPSSIGVERPTGAYVISSQLNQYAQSDPTGTLAWLANVLHAQGQ